METPTGRLWRASLLGAVLLLPGALLALAEDPVVARTLLESGLSSAEVMDLIPVKPLAEMEPQVAEMYRTRLPALFQKIKP